MTAVETFFVDIGAEVVTLMLWLLEKIDRVAILMT